MNATTEYEKALDTFPSPVNRPATVKPGKDLATATHKWMARAGIVARLADPTGTAQRQTRLHISFGALGQGTNPWGARFWEEDAPDGVQPIEWVLGSQDCIACVDDALHLLNSADGLVSSFGCC